MLQNCLLGCGCLDPIPNILYELKDNYNISAALKSQFSYRKHAESW